ncbi:MAG: SBBP repeat-containing protein, partial [Bacteroidales bacterium]
MLPKILKYRILFTTIFINLFINSYLFGADGNVRFPALFMKNMGQFSNGSEYCLKSAKSTTFFYNNHIVHQFVSSAQDDDTLNQEVLNMRIDFENSNANPVFEEREPLAAKSNFFIGNDPSKWETDISSFGTLAYKGLYNKIDLIYYTAKSGVKNDFIVHPGGKITDIILKYSGIKSVSINTQGDLVLATNAGDLTERIPEAYQMINGIKKLVKVQYTIKSGKQIGFHVSDYDPAYDLVIDPQLVYCSYIGGTGDDQFFHGNIIKDAQGNIYLAAKTKSTDFPVTPGSYSSAFQGLYDIVVFKFNPTATQLLFSTYIGGTDDDCPYGIALSGSSNDVVVAGWTRGSNFPISSGAIYQGTYAGGSCDGFVLKLDNSGSALLFSTYIGSNLEDYIQDMIVDASSNIYIAGYSSSNFPTTQGVYQSNNTNSGTYDLFVSKMNPTGTILLASTMIGGTAHDRGHDVALDNSGNVYISGSAEGTFPTTAGAYDVTYNGGTKDVVVCKFNQGLTSLLYSTYLGSSGDDSPIDGFIVDNLNQVTIAGRCGSGFPTTASAYSQTFAGGTYDVFLAKLNPTFSSLVYSTLIGGTGSDQGYNLCLDNTGNPIITGLASAGFPTTSGCYDATFNGFDDAFVAKFNSTASQLLYSTYLGGSDTDYGVALMMNGDTAIIAGDTKSSNMPVTIAKKQNQKSFPAWFMKNQGQYSNGSKYCLKSAKSNTFFYDQHIVHQFISLGSGKDSANSSILNMQVDFENSNKNPVFEERNPTSGKTNFFIGNDPSKWHTDIESFGTLAYKNLYNFIDLVYYNETSGIKSDFVVHPKAKISDITLKYSGIKSISINDLGALQLFSESGEITEHIPEAYQMINGTKVLVKVNYKIEEEFRVKFEVQAYNPAFDLIIDPQLVYSSYFGGSNNEMWTTSVIRDNQQNMYFGGRTLSSNFPITPGAFSVANSGDYDAIVLKLNPAGTQLIFGTYIGSPGLDIASDILLSGPSNDILVLGVAGAAGFPTTAGAYQTVHAGLEDIFVLKLNNTGNSLIFSTLVGGSTDEQIANFCLDASGNIYVLGYAGFYFPTTPGAYQQTLEGDYDVVVFKLSANGSNLLYSTFLGGTARDRSGGIAIDNLSNIYVSSWVLGDFPTTAGAYDNSFNGGSDIAVSKFDPTLSTLIFSTLIGSPGDDLSVSDLFLDGSNNITLVGKAASGFPTTAGAYDQSFNGGDSDGVILKLNNTGTALLYSSYLGGPGSDNANEFTIDASGNLLITGSCQDGFPTTALPYDNTFNGGTTDCFVSKFNINTSSLMYSTYFGGNSSESGDAIAFSADTVIFIGETGSSNMPVTTNAYDPTFNGGGNDLFLAKILLTFEAAIADFTLPDTVCVNENITIQNTSTGGSSYYWNFCSGNLSTVPIGVNLGNLGSLSGPVYSALTKEGDNYFVFITNINNASISRLAFGNSLTNTPVATNLGNLGGILQPGIEGIQVKKDIFTGNWYGLIAGGQTNIMFRLNFGTSLSNTPTAENLGNISGLINYAHTIYAFYDNGNWYCFVGNYSTSTLLRLNFGNSLANTPVATNLDNNWGLSGPVGFYPIQDNGDWYMFVVNRTNSTLSRLSFGNSLVNIPSGSNIGNVGGAMNTPRSITILKDCGQITGFVVNEIPNDLVKLTFPNGLLSTPTGVSLGNVANFSFPHHISELFRVGDSLYAFVMNVTSNSISRLCFPSCTNASVSSSTLLNPPVYSYNSAGTYNVSLVVNEGLPSQSNACKDVVVVATPTPVITGSSAICVGEMLSLSTAASPGFIYQWSGPNGFISTSQNVSIPNATTINSGTYTLIVTIGGCASLPATKVVTVSVTSVANAGSDGSTCGTTPFSLSGATATGATSYLWSTSGSGGFNNSGSLNPIYTPSLADINASSVTLTLIPSSGTACLGTTDAMLLTIQKEPIVYAGSNATICQGNSFTVSTASQQNSESLVWSPSGTGTLSNATSLTPTYIPAVNETGNVTLTLTGSGIAPCTNSIDQMIITINPLPVINAGNDITVCETAETIPITGATANANASLLWTRSGTGTFDDPTVINPIYTPSAADKTDGSVLLTLTATEPFCTDVTDQLTLHFSHQATANAGPDNSTCQLQPFTVSGASAPNSTSVSWIALGGLGNFTNANTLSPTYTPAIGDPNVLSVYLTAYSASPCPTATDFMYLTINPSPVAIAGDDASICEGASYTISGASTSNNLTYSWNENGSGYLTNTSGFTPTYIPGTGETGDVTISLSATGNPPCALVSDAMTLTINPPPIANAGQAGSICSGSNYTITNASAQHYSTILWSFVGTGTLSPLNSLTPTYIPGTNETGTVTFTLTAEGLQQCSSVQSTTTLTIVPAVSATAGPDALTCQGNPFTVSLANAQNSISTTWTKSGAGNLLNATTLTPTYVPDLGETGFITLTLAATGNSPCPAITDAMQLEIQAYPTAFAGNNASICQNSTYTIPGASATNFSTYTWAETGTGYLTGTNTMSPTYHPGTNETGTITISLTSNGLSNCLPVSHNMSLTIDPLPVADAGIDGISCQGFDYPITGATATNQNSVQWFENGLGYLSNPNSISAVYHPASNETGNVLLTLKVAGSQACSADTAIDTRLLTINPLPIVNAGSDNAFCAADPYLLSGSKSFCSSVNWSSSGNGTFLNQNSINATYFPSPEDKASGSIVLTITGQGSGECATQTHSDQVSLVIDPMPTIYSGVDEFLCVKDPVLLNGATSSNSSSVHWMGGDGIFSNANSLSPTYMPGTTDFNAGTVNLTLSANGLLTCALKTVSDNKMLSVTPYPVVYAGVDDYICSDKTQYQLAANAQHINNSSILWTQSGGDGHFNDSTFISPIYYPGTIDLTTINRQIIFTLTANGVDNCAATSVNDQVQLLIDPIPIPNAGPDGSVCGRNPFVLLNDSALYQQDITWSTSGDGEFINNSIVHPVYVPGPTDAGKTIVLSLHLLGCKGLDSDDFMLLTVHPNPSATMHGTTAICEGTSTEISIALTGTPPWNLTYTDGLTPVTVTTSASPFKFMVSPNTNSQWWITSANDKFCNVPTDSIHGFASISVNPLPEIFVVTGSNGGYYCEGDTGVLLGLNNSQTGMNYTLLHNGLSTGDTLAGTGSPLVFGYYASPGQYSVRGQNPSGNCIAMMNDTINIIMNPTPVTDFATNNSCYSDTTFFTLSGDYLQMTSTWNWDFGDGTYATYSA